MPTTPDEAPATLADVHEIAGGMPHVTVSAGSRGNDVYAVGAKPFVFFRNPRPDAADPLTGAWYDDVIVIWVRHPDQKSALVREPALPLFTTPHFDGHPSVLVRASRLGELTRAHVEELLGNAWYAQAPARWRDEWGQAHVTRSGGMHRHRLARLLLSGPDRALTALDVDMRDLLFAHAAEIGTISPVLNRQLHDLIDNNETELAVEILSEVLEAASRDKTATTRAALQKLSDEHDLADILRFSR